LRSFLRRSDTVHDHPVQWVVHIDVTTFVLELPVPVTLGVAPPEDAAVGAMIPFKCSENDTEELNVVPPFLPDFVDVSSNSVDEDDFFIRYITPTTTALHLSYLSFQISEATFCCRIFRRTLGTTVRVGCDRHKVPRHVQSSSYYPNGMPHQKENGYLLILVRDKPVVTPLYNPNIGSILTTVPGNCCDFWTYGNLENVCVCDLVDSCRSA
jgi:hypothetical protein